MLLVTAYARAAERTLTLVITNANSASIELTVAGTSGNTVQLPGRTITTLYATDYDPPTVAVTPQQGLARSRAGTRAAVRSCDIRGRTAAVPGTVGQRMAPGACCRFDDDGNAAVACGVPRN